MAALRPYNDPEYRAMKRALKSFGYPFGLALYDKEKKHVDNSAEREEIERAAAERQAVAEEKSRNALAKALAALNRAESVDGVEDIRSKAEGYWKEGVPSELTAAIEERLGIMIPPADGGIPL